MDLDEMMTQCERWRIRKGWDKEVLTFGDCAALVTTEISEAVDTFRKQGLMPVTHPDGKPDDVGSEMADVLIRLFHWADYFGIDLLHEFVRKMAYNETRSYQHGGKTMGDKNAAIQQSMERRND